MLCRIALTLFVALCTTIFYEPELFAQWQPVSDGAEILRDPIRGDISMTYLRISLDRFDVRVATPSVPKFGASPSEVALNPERSPRGLLLEDYVSRYDALAAISAGYVVSFSPPTPLGQIKSDGFVVGVPHSSWATEGAFCSDKGRASIEIAADLRAMPGYRDCLQSGPVLLLQGALPTGLPSSSATGGDYDKMVKGQVTQAMICIDAMGRVLLGVTAKSGVALSEMVAKLQQSPINCLNAIRLQPGGMRINSDLFGVDRFLHPSAIVVVK